MFACVEPIDVSEEISSVKSLEGIMIIESNITDIEKLQRVLLSRMLRVESDSTVNVEEDRLFVANSPFLIKHGLRPDFESDAHVEVKDNIGNVYPFEEIEPGTYESTSPFAALPNTTYQLLVRTQDGEEYNSLEMQTPISSEIENIHAERIVNGNGEEGMGIFVDTSFPEDSDKFFRYTFEETYKIIAPQWTLYEFEIIRDELEFVLDNFGNVEGILYPDVRLIPRVREEQVCYKTDVSNVETLFNANVLNSSIATKNRVRFISRNNPIISHRYSILIRQFGISGDSFEFYERLRAFSQSESVFSQIQPGSLEGNVSNVNGSAGVIGYFDVSSETSERLYFNYEDFFPNEPLPPYFGTFDCTRLLSPPLPNPERDGPPSPDGPCPYPLVDRINLELVEYYDVNQGPGICEGPYYVVPRICGDCNVVGSNIAPDFWVE